MLLHTGLLCHAAKCKNRVTVKNMVLNSYRIGKNRVGRDADMRKAQKQEILEIVKGLQQAHEEIKKALGQKNAAQAQNTELSNLQSVQRMLCECQEFAVSLGENIERLEGEGHITVSYLESYCEALFHIFEDIGNGIVHESKIYKTLRKQLIRIENSVKNDINVRVEAVFLPYKASMWDSLESVWKAAEADPDCDAYVIPIPYYDKTPDGAFREMHYEGDRYPKEVPVIKYDKFDFEAHHPDMIFIHNPYDEANYVTSVHPFFYSSNLKKYTDCLVYIPYYATSGNMDENQSLSPAYLNADYIVIQSEKYRRFFAPGLSDSKFLAMGSPKFDSVIQKCQNPPKPPKEWEKKIYGSDGDCSRRKVYFYNTSINGMLGKTDAFLNKMRYVFETFQGRDDVCLLWRPHPLLEPTLNSLRGEYKAEYLELKRRFLEEDVGIYDDTADIEASIALSDVYIGDMMTSVTSLFGVAGKPLFILNNYISTLPGEDDWRGDRIRPVFDPWGNDRYQVTKNNQLWFSEKGDYHYRFYMDLECGYFGALYYLKALEIGDRIYVLPGDARHLLIIKDKRIRKIPLEDKVTQMGAFYNYWYNEKYIFLFPYRYPCLVRFTIATEKVEYIDGVRQFNVRNVNGEWKVGGISQYGNELVFASPVDNQFLFMDMDTIEARRLSSKTTCNLGTMTIVPDGEELWLLPMDGMTLSCWNPKTGQVKEYNDLPEGFQSIKWPYDIPCEKRPFGNVVVSRDDGKETIVISPYWGNMCLSLDRQTGKMEEWRPPIEFTNRGKNGYFLSTGTGGFVPEPLRQGKADRRIWHMPERKLYEVNIETKECREAEIEFAYEDIVAHEPGFAEESEWMQYCLKEDALHSLKDFLDGNIIGNPFDRERQLKAFSKINANAGGTCGKNVYEFVKDKIVR